MSSCFTKVQTVTHANSSINPGINKYSTTTSKTVVTEPCFVCQSKTMVEPWYSETLKASYISDYLTRTISSKSASNNVSEIH